MYTFTYVIANTHLRQTMLNMNKNNLQCRVDEVSRAYTRIRKYDTIRFYLIHVSRAIYG